MPFRPGVDDDEGLERLIQVWKDGSADLDSRLAVVERRIMAELARPEIDSNVIYRLGLQRERIGELQGVAGAIIDDLTTSTERFLQGGGLDRIYAAGAGVAHQAAGAALPFSFTAPHRAAVDVMAQDLFDDVLQATAYVEDGLKDYVRRVGRALTGVKLTGGIPVKTQARSLRDQLRTEFGRHGATAVTYRDGSRHAFGEYAEMLLRTKTGVAYNMGTLNSSRLLGIEVFEILDGAECGLVAHHDPELANGRIVTLEFAVAYPLSHPNAFLGRQSFRSVGALRQIVRARYAGPAVRIHTTEGHNTAVTPEHPVLTRRGWVLAAEVEPGDHVLRYDERIPAEAGPHFDQGPMVEDRFAALVETCGHARVVPASDDLHGAAVFCDPEIDVVDLHGVLVDDLGSLGLEGSRQLQLSGGGLPRVCVAGGPGEEFVPGVAFAPNGGVGGVDHGPAGVGAGGGPPVEHRFGSSWHAVSRVERFEYRGPVYDASTVGECYTVGGLVVANCRRAIAPRPDLKGVDDPNFQSVQAPEARDDQAAFEKALRQQQAARSSGVRPGRQGRTGRTGRSGRQGRPGRAGRSARTEAPGQFNQRLTPAQEAARADRLRRREYVLRTKAAAQEAARLERLAAARQRAKAAGFRGEVDPDVLQRWQITEEQFLNARAIVGDIKADIRGAAKAQADELGDWLFNNELNSLSRPERLVRRTDMISGQTRFARTQGGYDWMEQLDSAELARVRTRMVDSDLFTPDVLADLVRSKTGQDFTDDEAIGWVLDRWLQEDGLRSVASGRLPKYADPGSLMPAEQGLEGYRLDQLFGVELDDAAGHVATVQAETAAREAASILGSPTTGPAPWQMEFSEYLRDLEQVEDILGRTQLAPGIDPGEAFAYARERLQELAPPGIDPDGNLNPVELFERIRITAQSAGLPTSP